MEWVLVLCWLQCEPINFGADESGCRELEAMGKAGKLASRPWTGKGGWIFTEKQPPPLGSIQVWSAKCEPTPAGEPVS